MTPIKMSNIELYNELLKIKFISYISDLFQLLLSAYKHVYML